MFVRNNEGKTRVNSNLIKQIQKRRTFAIISHPDAGKTTITEKILLFGNVIQKAGTVKSRGSNQYVKSDWMKIEKKRGISVTTSVMQFPYKDCLINLLDTPGHKDFSEDTYRTLTAVDSCLMVIDAAKGIEDRTRKLIKITRLRKTPIITFVNKLDRDVQEPMEILDAIQNEIGACTPISWPIGYGKRFRGLYHIHRNETILYKSGHGHEIRKTHVIKDLYNLDLDKAIGKDLAENTREELELIINAYPKFDQNHFLASKLTPVYFGTALGNFGVDYILDGLTKWAPPPRFHQANERLVKASEEKFSGFVFKIQANMDHKHHDRIAFIRIVSGKYLRGMKINHVRINKIIGADAVVFIAGCRKRAEQAYPGDIIGLHNHGTIKIGDTFTQGEKLKFSGIPNFAPEFLRRICLKEPLKQKQLLRALIHLSEEGAIQIFRPLQNNDLIVGAIGTLQFDVVVERLKIEYNVEIIYKDINAITARWIESENSRKLEEFKNKNRANLALDSGGNLSYIAPTMLNLNLVRERFPNIEFYSTREH
ncbi:peptide chain release factor [Candidatus Photodesmus blepharus]|uniref:Peptide chain release factor 3 n=1 Tax=Candidatus Photodesmus blepharonis TaxID=1179155 RepID=A0A084CMK0_9GAMM|nr:peptide chain release factor 3 [Candidatus Photodesmus blepharus]KEY91029.1 peptide chain release factor [Candidatus Photodesmus blepharus]